MQIILKKNNKEKMTFKNNALIVLFSFILFVTTSSAQTNINASGGNAIDEGGSASYSIGQIVYSFNNGANGSVYEGVQQPYEISVVTGLSDASFISLSASVFPNPTSDFQQLKIDASTTFSIQSFSYFLYDMNGKLLQEKNLEGNITKIDMSNLTPSNYFLKVLQGTKELKTFKVIKN